MADLHTSEISSRVYNTRPHKQQKYKPLRGNPADVKSDTGDEDVSVDTHSPQQSTSQPPPESPVVPPAKPEKQVQLLQPVDAANKLISKIDRKLKMRIERIEQAKSLSALLGKLRKLCSIDSEVLKLMTRGDTLAVLLSSSEFITRFEFLTEETLQCCVLVTRSDDTRTTALDILLTHGCFILCLATLRYYKHNASARVMAVELLHRMLEAIQKYSLTNGPGGIKDGDNTKYYTDAYVTHQLLLHGAASSFPSVLCIFVEADIEISTMRLLQCNISLCFCCLSGLLLNYRLIVCIVYMYRFEIFTITHSH